MLRHRTMSRWLVAATVFASTFSFGAIAHAQSDSGSGDGTSFLPPGFPCLQPSVYPLPFLNWGWTSLDGREPGFVSGPPEASGAGSLDMSVPLVGDRVSYFQAGISTPLRDLAANPNSLGFMHRGPYVSFQLRIRNAERTDGDRSGFTSLVWEPTYNNNEGETRWANTRNLAEGKWWSTRDIAGLPANATQTLTLAEISAANPRAQVSAYGVQNNEGRGGADNIVYGCARWDFEPLPGSGSGLSSGG